jgi:acyl carrier protein
MWSLLQQCDWKAHDFAWNSSRDSYKISEKSAARIGRSVHSTSDMRSASDRVAAHRGTAVMSDLLRDQIRDFILRNYLFTADPTALGLDDSLLNRGIVDSTGMLEIISFIEQQLGVKVNDDELTPDNLDGVNRIVGYVESKRRQA